MLVPPLAAAPVHHRGTRRPPLRPGLMVLCCLLLALLPLHGLRPPSLLLLLGSAGAPAPAPPATRGPQAWPGHRPAPVGPGAAGGAAGAGRGTRRGGLPLHPGDGEGAAAGRPWRRGAGAGAAEGAGGAIAVALAGAVLALLLPLWAGLLLGGLRLRGAPRGGDAGRGAVPAVGLEPAARPPPRPAPPAGPSLSRTRPPPMCDSIGLSPMQPLQTDTADPAGGVRRGLCWGLPVAAPVLAAASVPRRGALRGCASAAVAAAAAAAAPLAHAPLCLSVAVHDVGDFDGWLAAANPLASPVLPPGCVYRVVGRGVGPSSAAAMVVSFFPRTALRAVQQHYAGTLFGGARCVWGLSVGTARRGTECIAVLMRSQ